MKRVWIGITGLSGEVGLGVIKGLREVLPRPRVVGFDSSDGCAAAHLVDAWVRAPLVRHPDYPAWLETRLAERPVSMLFCGIDSEVPILSRARAALEASTGCKIAVERPEITATFCDKVATAGWLADHGLPALPTLELPSSLEEIVATVGFPLLLKPRQGHGAVGVERIDSAAQLARRLPQLDAGWCVQRYVDGPEYTVGLLFDRDRRLADHLVLRRELVQGRTLSADVVRDCELDAFCIRVARELEGEFALNLQLRVDATGTPWVFEVNPRLSGSTALRVALGFNDPARLVRHHLGGEPMSAARVENARAYRLFDEMVVPAARAVVTAVATKPPPRIATIETLVFDCGDTLLTLTPSREDVCRRVLARLGEHRPLEAIAEAYARTEFARPQKANEVGDDVLRVDYYAAHNRLLATCLGLESRWEEMHQLLLTAFRGDMRPHWAAIDGARETLAALKPRFRLFVLANWDRTLRDRLDDLGLLDQLAGAWSSAELGADKPAPECFASFCREASVEPARAAYLGNDYRVDVAGARAAGFFPVLVDHFGRGPIDADCPVATSFPDVLALFGVEPEVAA